MEHVVQDLRFRFTHRGRLVEVAGRSVESEGRFRLQAWVHSPEDPNQILEVAPVPSMAQAWRLFQQLGAHTGFEPREYREVAPDGSVSEWKPIPGASAS